MPVFRRPDGNITEKRTGKSGEDAPPPEKADKPGADAPGPFDASTKRMETGPTPLDAARGGADTAGGGERPAIGERGPPGERRRDGRHG